jgi:hypothetical protein
MNIFSEQNNVFKSVKAYNSTYLNNDLTSDKTPISDTELKQYIFKLQTEISNLKKTSASKTHAEYDRALIKLIADYREMANQRADLDVRLEELYDMNSSKRALSKRELDSSMYANILWTILATLIIYVVFVYL